MMGTMSLRQPENWLYEIWQKGYDSPCYVMVPNAKVCIRRTRKKYNMYSYFYKCISERDLSATPFSISIPRLQTQFHLAILLIFCAQISFESHQKQENGEKTFQGLSNVHHLYSKTVNFSVEKKIQNTLFCANFSTRKKNKFLCST